MDMQDQMGFGIATSITFSSLYMGSHIERAQASIIDVIVAKFFPSRNHKKRKLTNLHAFFKTLVVKKWEL